MLTDIAIIDSCQKEADRFEGAMGKRLWSSL